VLFVGPHQPYLAYVADVLPSLGEEGVQTCTVRDLLPEGSSAGIEPDPAVALLKASARLVHAVDAAVDVYEEPPGTALRVETPWSDVRLDPADWAEAFEAAPPGMPHNEARDEVWDALVAILHDKHDGEVPVELLRRSLLHNGELLRAFNRAWPLLEATDVVGDLWSVPAYLRKCAPWLGTDEVRSLQRAEPHAWTVSDLPLLDAARQRLGDPDAARQRRRREVDRAAVQHEMDQVVADLVAADDSEMQVMSMLRGADLNAALVEDAGSAADDRDLLAGPFAHVVVDEAQELTDAEWQMLLRRCPSRSFTIVGDRAQARRGFAESWSERLQRVGFGFDAVTVAALTINYRTPREVMAAAEPVIRAAVPDANVPVSVRSTDVPVRRGSVAELDGIIAEWLTAHEDGVACVIGDPGFPASSRVRSLTPELAKGLEFDLVVLVEPDRPGGGLAATVDRYVAMTRATQQLVVLTHG
jgi:superfamily I DNA/RNA helicase